MSKELRKSAEASVPFARLRRLRRTEGLRRLVREHALSVDDLIYPLFITHGKGVKEPVPSMPGMYRFSVDKLAGRVGRNCLPAHSGRHVVWCTGA